MSLTSTKQNCIRLHLASFLLLLSSAYLLTPSRAAGTCSVPTFEAPIVSVVGGVGEAVTADFNGDGKVDVAAIATGFSQSAVTVTLGGGDGTFAFASTWPVPSVPVSIDTGDFNGDGKADLVVGNSPGGPAVVTVLFGDGAGGFPTRSEISPIQDAEIIFVTVADINGDGKADIVTALPRDETVMLLLGDGAGKFTPTQIYAGGFNLSAAVAADFNRDGRLDLALRAAAVGNIAILLGDGAGGFAAPVEFPTSIGPGSLAVGDFNGDGSPDLAVTGTSNQQAAVAVLLGDGAGGLAAAAIFAVSEIRELAGPLKAADMNGDGRLDLLVGIPTNNQIIILKGDGTGRFTKVAARPGDSNSITSTRDVNGDGLPDLILLRFPESFITLLNTCGSAGPATLQFEGPSSVNVGEGSSPATFRVVRTGSLDGAASVDYATSDGTADASDYVPNSGTLQFAEGETSKSFNVAIKDDQISEGDETFNLTLSNPTGAALGGQSTAVVLIAANDAVPTVFIDSASVVEGNGGTTDAVFTVGVSNPSGFTITMDYETWDDTAAADEDYVAASGTLTFSPGETRKTITIRVNGDTLEETTETFLVRLKNLTNAVFKQTGNIVASLQATGTVRDDDSSCPEPSFGPRQFFAAGPGPWAVVAADFNRDGKLDLAVGNSNSASVSILAGDGAGGFAAPSTFPTAVRPRALAVGDFDGDGRLDLVVAGPGASLVAVMLGNGAGGFITPSFFGVGSEPASVTVGDLNGDGRADLAVANSGSSNVSVLPGNGAGGFAAATDYAVGGGPVTVAAADFNRDGRLDLVTANRNSDNISVLINTGGGTFAPAVVFPNGRGTQSLAVADFNADGIPDLAVAGGSGFMNLSILLGDGAGGFTAAGSFSTNLNPNFVVAADFNGDSQVDLAVAQSLIALRSSAGFVSVLFGNGRGRFSAPSGYLTGSSGAFPFGLAAGDFDGNGRPDLAAPSFNQSGVSVLLNACSTIKSAPRVQFSSPSYKVSEETGSAVITVIRSGDASAPASVEYATSDGTASARGDYTTALGRLVFAAGETSKTFTVFVTDDALVESPETINLTLSGAEGASVGVPGASTVTVGSDDAAGSLANPIDGDAFFLRQHYRDFLNRDPDPSGLAFWTGEITRCGADPGCREVKRINVSAAFFLSIEFQETGFLVYRMQVASYGTQPRYLAFLRDTKAVGRAVVVNQGDWQARLEANKRALADEWVARPEFRTLYDGKTNAQYVDALIASTGVAFTQAARDALVAGLSGGTETRATVLRKVSEEQTFARKEFNRAFVQMQYFGYLRRNPEDAPDSDISGYNFWLAKLDQFRGDYVAAEMIKAFLESIEYRKRFGE